MIRPRITFLCNGELRKDHVAWFCVKEESMTSGDIAVSQRTLPSPEAFKMPKSRRPRQS